MDPIGFGLENFDAAGGWRTHDGKFPVDSTGTLPSGQSFTGAAGLWYHIGEIETAVRWKINAVTVVSQPACSSRVRTRQFFTPHSPKAQSFRRSIS